MSNKARAFMTFEEWYQWEGQRRKNPNTWHYPTKLVYIDGPFRKKGYPAYLTCRITSRYSGEPTERLNGYKL